MQTKASPYLTTLTPLRGIAALFVGFFHCNKFYRVFLPPGHTEFLELSWLWVDFFFILSGFIMCYAYGRHFQNGVTRTAFKNYIAARFARVYPLHLITTCWAFICAAMIVPVAAGLDPVFVDMFDKKAIGACLLLVQSMHVGYISAPLNNPSWSLSTEWWAYMLFPFFVPWFFRLKNNGKLLAAALIIGFYVIIKYIEHSSWGMGGQPPNMITDFGFLRCLAGFLAGMLLYVFFEHRSGFNILSKDWFFAISFFGVLAALHFGINHFLIICFFPFVLIAAAYNRSWVKRILDTKALQRLGDWSFSIYMVHFPIIFTFYIFDAHRSPTMFADLNGFFNRPPDYITGLIMCLVIISLTLVISALFYRFIEVPSRNYLNKVFHTRHKKIPANSLKV